jgi:hypothetical protein
MLGKGAGRCWEGVVAMGVAWVGMGGGGGGGAWGGGGGGWGGGWKTKFHYSLR